MKDLFQAVMKFQAECPKISKDSNNPFFSDAKRKVNYASLPHILGIIQPILNKHGLVLMQPVVNDVVITKLIHVESGDVLESIYEITCKDKTNPQQIGSAVSYARRYSITSILNLNIDDESDDDGNSANNNIIKSQTPQKEELTPKHPMWTKAVKFLQEGGLFADVEMKYIVSEANKKLLFTTK